MNFKSIGIPTIKLLVIAAVITILLFLTNNTTEAKIAQNQADANERLIEHFTGSFQGRGSRCPACGTTGSAKSRWTF